MHRELPEIGRRGGGGSVCVRQHAGRVTNGSSHGGGMEGLVAESTYPSRGVAW